MFSTSKVHCERKKVVKYGFNTVQLTLHAAPRASALSILSLLDLTLVQWRLQVAKLFSSRVRGILGEAL